MEAEKDENKVTFEEALDETGFGLYSCVLVSLAGLIVISMVCIAYGNTIIIPTSACELQTTTSQRGLLAAAPVVGLILGGALWGYLADVFGRRYTLIISLLMASTVNALASISINWVMLMILQFIATLLSSGQFSQAMTILSESVPIAKRNLSILLVSSIFLLAQGIMAVLAIPIIPLTFSYYLPTLGIYWNSWRLLLLMYSAPSLISVLCLVLMSESPKFLFTKGRETEAVNTLKKIYKVNNFWRKKEPQFQAISLEETLNSGPKMTKNKIVPLFKPPLLKSTLVLTTLFLFQSVGPFLVWLPTIVDQIVKILETGEGSNLSLCSIIRLSIGTPPDPDVVPCSLNVTTLLIVLAVGAAQSLANILISLVINRTGRRNMVIFVTALCGVCGVIANLVPNAIGSAVIFFVFLIGIVTHGLYTAIAVALFPTSLRTLAVALTMTGSRAGTFAIVQILNFLLETNCEIGFYVFGTLFAASALVAAFLADDRYPDRIVHYSTKF